MAKLQAGTKLPEIKAGAPFIFEVGEKEYVQIKSTVDIDGGTFEVSPVSVDAVMYSNKKDNSSLVYYEHRDGNGTVSSQVFN